MNKKYIKLIQKSIIKIILKITITLYKLTSEYSYILNINMFGNSILKNVKISYINIKTIQML